MNVFTALARPLADRPGDALVRPRPRQPQPQRTFGGRFPHRPNRWNLSPVECEIMRLITEEWLTQNEVAARLTRSAKTIQTHCERIRNKMGARNQYHAIVMWDRYFRPQPVILNFSIQEAA